MADPAPNLPAASREAASPGGGRPPTKDELHAIIYYRRLNDETGSFIFVGGWPLDVTGYSRSDFEKDGGVSFADLVHPDDLERTVKEIRSELREDHVFQFWYRIRQADGREKLVIDRCRAIWSQEGKVQFFEGIIADTAKCGKIQDQIGSDEERFRAMMQASFEGIALHDKGVFLDGNPAFAKMLGFDPGELNGRSVLDVIAKEDHERVMKNVRAGYTKPYQLKAVRKDGSRFAAEVRGKDLIYHGKQMRVVAVRDISIFKQAEEALRSANEILEVKVEERTRELRERQADLNRMNQGLLRELALARKVQESLLPGRSLVKPGISISVSYVPAFEIGGDAYNFIQLADGRVAALIADLTGHGIQAALSTVLVNSTFSSHSGEAESPQAILRSMNAALRSGLPSGTYAAALVLTLDPQSGKCEILNAGIPDPLLIRHGSSEVDTVSCRGPLLGVLDDREYERFEQETLVLSPQDRLLLFTDGLDEVRNDRGEFFGRKRLRDYLLEVRGESQERVPELLVSEARKFCGSLHAWDDVTVLSFLRTP